VKISGNGRYVIFTSADPELVADDTNDGADVFVRDLQLGSTVRVNLRADGAQADGTGLGTAVDISDDGRYVLFQSGSDLTGGGAPLPNGYRWFVRDLQLGTLASIPAFDGFNGAVLSGDGQHAAILDVDAGIYRVRMFDLGLGVRTVLSIPSGDGFVGGRPALSHDGHYVAFVFRSATLLGGVAASANQIGIIDTQATDPSTTLELVTRTAGGLPGDGGSSAPQLSADGRYVLFTSRAPALTNGVGQPCCGPAVALRDRVANTTSAASRDANGVPIAAPDTAAALSSDGGTVAFITDIASVLGGGALGGTQVFVAPRP
jgi:Tol biopolymer transport system component